MRAEAAPLLGVERLFEQGSEDRRVHIAPIVFGGAAQLADLLSAERQNLAGPEELAVESLHLGFERIGEIARVHGLPELTDHGCKLARIGFAALQHALERGFGQ